MQAVPFVADSQDAMPRRVALPVFLFIAALAIWALWGPNESSERTSSTASADPTARVSPREIGQPSSSKGLEPARVSGKIVDTEGQPIPGAQACARYRLGGRKFRIGRDPVCVEADADGRYEILGLMARPLTVSGQAPGHAAAYHRAPGESRSGGTLVEPRAGESTNDIDIQLPGGAVEVFGLVEDMSGGPIEGARVDLWSSGRGVTLTAPELARSDEAGKFSGWMLPGNATGAPWGAFPASSSR